MKRCKRGFTLTELLITVAILVILLTAAIPGIVAIKGRLEILRLNDYARQIFVQAQNQMVARSNSGSLADIDSEAEESSPQDDYLWLTSSEDVGRLLEGDALNIMEAGHYTVLKYNPTTATVLEVYYSASPMAITSVRAGSYSGAANADTRRTAKIGYYDGGDVEVGQGKKLPTPVLTVENSEKLKVKVEVPADVTLTGVIGSVTVTVQELSTEGKIVAGKSFTLPSAAGIPIVAGASGSSLEWVLDSLESGSHFYEIAGASFTPGADLLVTAELKYTSGAAAGVTCLPSSAEARVNSLFESRDGNTAKIANGRHLQNLNYATSHVGAAANPASSDDPPAITAAVQTDTISWSATQAVYGANYRFQPITNAAFTSYDGQNNEIQNLYIRIDSSTSAVNAGLFATKSGGALAGIRLCNPRVINYANGNGSGTGALAGTLTGVTVTRCGAYSEGSEVIGDSEYVGGLIGRATDCTVTESYAALKMIESSAYGRTQGGLIGCARRTAVSDSYANIGLLGADEYTWDADRGFRAPNATIYKGRVGGLIGQVTGAGGEAHTTVTDCYACGYVNIANEACGLIGPGSLTGYCTLTNSCSLLSYSTGVTNSYGLWKAGGASNCVYWQNGGCKETSATYGKTLQQIIDGWSGTAGKWSVGGTCYVYAPARVSPPYPFPRLTVVPVYGHWPSEDPTPPVNLADAFIEVAYNTETGFLVFNALYMEQIPGYTGYGNERVFMAFDTGNPDTTSFDWAYCVDGTNWIPITSEIGELKDQNGVLRAYVQLVTEDAFITHGSKDYSSVTTAHVNAVVSQDNSQFTFQIRALHVGTSPESYVNKYGYNIASSFYRDIIIERRWYYAIHSAQPPLTVAPCTLDEVNAAFGLSLTAADWATGRTSGRWHLDSGKELFLKLTGTASLDGFSVTGADGAYLTVDSVTAADAVYLRLRALWPDSDTGTEKDLTLTISTAASSTTETVRVLKAHIAPSPAPTAEPSPAPTAAPSTEPSAAPTAAPSTAPTAEPAPAQTTAPLLNAPPSAEPTPSPEPAPAPDP